jgi:4-amino-4-deoxy-L-arabinose transferase-like glycosyltransferase
MTVKPVALVVAVVCIGAAAALYGHRLGEVPPYAGLDEAHFAVHAHSLATTGRDLNGSLLPLFVNLEDPLGDRPQLAWGATWYHPLGFYLIAAALTVLPMDEWAIRLPFVLIGLLNVILIYATARRWYGDRWVGLTAAALLLLSPAHFILSRLALDYLLPLPFTLGWLLALIVLMRDPSRRTAMVTGLILGAGCFSYVSSWLIMPIYLLITIVVTMRSIGRRDLLMPLVLGFALPVLALVPWFVAHPAMPGNLIAQYQAGETRTSVLTAIATWRDVPAALRDALATYWSYFNPSFLFVTGGVSRMVSTGSIGVWPLGMAVLLIVAIERLVRVSPAATTMVLIAGLLTAPLPAALKGEPFAIQRAIGLLPFGVLLAAGALVNLRGTRHFIEITVIAIALISIPLQFSGFLEDYYGDYRPRSARALDSTAFRETAEFLIARTARGQEPAIAITAPLYDVSAKWRFYCTKAGRESWLERTRYFGGPVRVLTDLALPAGSLAVVETAVVDAQGVPGGWVRLAAPPSLFGETPLTILERQ